MASETISASGRRGHPFRMTVSAAHAAAARARDDSDLRLFALSFTAFFICIYTFVM